MADETSTLEDGESKRESVYEEEVIEDGDEEIIEEEVIDDDVEEEVIEDEEVYVDENGEEIIIEEEDTARQSSSQFEDVPVEDDYVKETFEYASSDDDDIPFMDTDDEMEAALRQSKLEAEAAAKAAVDASDDQGIDASGHNDAGTASVLSSWRHQSTGGNDDAQPPPQSAGNVAPVAPGDDDLEMQAKRGSQVDPSGRSTKKRSASYQALDVQKEHTNWWNVLYMVMIFLAFVAIACGIYFGLFFEGDDSEDGTRGDIETSAPSAAPTANPGSGTTTAFDDIDESRSCDFSRSDFPHPFDQCYCTGQIIELPDDVRKRYEIHLEDFVPEIYQDYDEEISSCSDRNQALVWLSSANDADFTHEQRLERFSLATMYASMNGPEWNFNREWLSTSDVCFWSGISCSDGNVSGMSLRSLNVGGSVSKVSFSSIQHCLHKRFLIIKLIAVYTTDQIPREVILLESLREFVVTSNPSMGGTIAPELFQIPAIEVVNLGSNGLTGPLPEAVGQAKRLRFLNLEGNNLSGRITSSLDGAESLSYLNLQSNGFLGEVPDTLFGAPLQELYLSDNVLTGTLPIAMGQATDLRILEFGTNLFDGPIVTQIGRLTNLETLSIIDLPNVRGRLPAEFGSLSKLQELTITNTGIFGPIPSTWRGMEQIETMIMNDNALRNELPVELGFLTKLRVLRLSNNLFTGAIPAEMSFMESLQQLHLNDNSLTGDIPIDFTILSKLEVLRLDGNELATKVDPEVCDLRNLSLETFLVDCPGRDGDQITGVICSIPDCCTDCRL